MVFVAAFAMLFVVLRVILWAAPPARMSVAEAVGV
jgi:hypothetical protein